MIKILFLRNVYRGGQQLNNLSISLESLSEIKPTVETFEPGCLVWATHQVPLTHLALDCIVKFMFMPGMAWVHSNIIVASLRTHRRNFRFPFRSKHTSEQLVCPFKVSE